MAISTRRVIVVRYIWRILRKWIGDIGIYRIAIAEELPIARNGDYIPHPIIVVTLPETLGTLCWGLGPIETPITADIQLPL
jgi:hypothetical protein